MKSIPYRRKREGRTNYKKRLTLLKSRQPRLVVRRTNTQMIAQVAIYDEKGDKILCGVNSKELKKLGWTYSCANLPAAYVTGRLLSKKVKDKKLALGSELVLDIGLHTPVKKGRIYALVKGVVDGGLKVACSEEIFPEEKRLFGEHIADYAKKPKDKVAFSKYKDADKLRSVLESIVKKL